MTEIVEFVRYNKYEVLKLDDIDQFLLYAQRKSLESIIRTIQAGRKSLGKRPCNSYVVVNEEEPYAEIVWSLIELGEQLRVAKGATDGVGV